MLTVPAVVSINRNTPAGQYTNASSVSYSVTFNESVTNVLSGDFRVVTGGPLAASTPVAVSGSGSAYTVTVSGIHGSGSLQLDLIDDDSIVDGSNVPLGGVGVKNGSFQGQAYTIDQAFPYVQSINRSNPAGTSAGGPSVTYAVTFSEPVTGVVPGDFTLALGGSVTATTPVVVSGSGASYTVTVNGISGQGTLGLNLTDNGAIHDLAGNPLIQANAPASFGPPSTIAVGANPSAVAVADVNGDGIPDLIMTNENDNDVGVLLGHGDGTFAPIALYSVGTGPTSVQVIDVNGDGKPDLIVDNFTLNFISISSSVSVMLNNGNGTFSTTTYSYGAGPNAEAADLNGDGKADLVVDNDVLFGGGDTLGVRLGNGNGTFGGQATYASGSGPTSIVVQDFNGDGKPDLATVNGNSDNVGLFLGTGSGTFGAQTTFATGSLPNFLETADLNGDGKADLVVTNQNDNTVSVLLGNGAGSFAAQVPYSVGSTPTSLDVADVNGDGIPDIVTSNQASNNVSVLLGNGNGTFAPQTTLASGNGPNSVVIADLNGDGRPDLIVANGAANTLSVRLNNANGNLTGQVYTITSAPTVDLNGAAAGTGFTNLWSPSIAPVSVGGQAGAAPNNATVSFSSNITSMTLTLNDTGIATDVLTATTTGTSITASYAPATVSTPGTLSLSGSDTAANYQQVLESVTYDNTNHTLETGGPGVASETVSVQAFAGAASSNVAVATINIDIHAPVVTTGAAATWANTGPVAIDSSGAITDSDSGNLTQLTATMSSVHAGDALSAMAAFGISVSGSGTASLTLSGSDTIAHYVFVLDSITYDNTSGGPGGSSVTVNLQATDDGSLVGPVAAQTVNIAPPTPASVVNRLLFYKGSSRFDGTGGPREPLPFSDDNAIATDKSAYLPGSGATTFANVSSYTLGINGLMVDISGTHGTLSASDFTFKTGNNNSPSTWATVAAAATVTTRPGAGTSGSDRIEITFPDGAIQKTWLEVIFKGNDGLGGSDTNTNLAASNVFFWGNALADDGTTPDDSSAYRTSANDELDARNNPKTLINNIPITNLQDYNRDGLVSAIDQLAARNNPTTNISGPHILNIAGGGPFAPDATASAAPAASPTSSSAATPLGLSLSSSLPSSLPPWLENRLQNVLDSAPVVRILHNLEQANTPTARQILQTIDAIADKYNLHDDVLDGILVDLGLE